MVEESCRIQLSYSNCRLRLQSFLWYVCFAKSSPRILFGATFFIIIFSYSWVLSYLVVCVHSRLPLFNQSLHLAGLRAFVPPPVLTHLLTSNLIALPLQIQGCM